MWAWAWVSAWEPPGRRWLLAGGQGEEGEGEICSDKSKLGNKNRIRVSGAWRRNLFLLNISAWQDSDDIAMIHLSREDKGK